MAASSSTSSISSTSQAPSGSRTPLQKFNRMLSNTFKRTPTRSQSPNQPLKRDSSFYCTGPQGTPSSTSLASTNTAASASHFHAGDDDDSDLDIALPADLFEEYRKKQAKERATSPCNARIPTAATASAASLNSTHTGDDHTQRPTGVPLQRAATSPPRLNSTRTTRSRPLPQSDSGSSGDSGPARK